ncbi:MAG: hypothetical protein JNM72_06005 [Deltaproteobacteria bacterium]|nr:hypothetical protein [Deltaproteobacteria bacterium]
MRWLTLIFTLLLVLPSSALGAGYLRWDYGMTREQVQARSEHGPYYQFQNGDLGSQGGPFQGHTVPISFYFRDDKLVRIMLIPYMGDDAQAMDTAVRMAITQLQEEFGGVELPSSGQGRATLDEVMAAYAAQVPLLAPGQRFQFGAHPMPEGHTVWVSVTATGQGQYIVALNYGESSPPMPSRKSLRKARRLIRGARGPAPPPQAG